MKHFFKKRTTVYYPEEKRSFSENFRGLHSLKRDENGAERCTACGLCALSCPAEAITMTAAERKPGEELLYREEKYASVYEINMLRCIFCGFCEEACPKAAIFFGKDKLTEPVIK
jgi:NADH-quinone oxidoreductase subunit I